MNDDVYTICYDRVSTKEVDSTLIQLRDFWIEENEKVAGAWYFACCLEMLITRGCVTSQVGVYLQFFDSSL